MKRTLSAVKQVVSCEQARETVREHSADFTPCVQRVIYYPYHWFYFTGAARFLFWERRLRASCMVDLINRQAATSDMFDREEITADEEDILNAAIGPDEARKLAETYAVHTAIHRMHSLLLPRFELIEDSPVHMPFWIVKCAHPRKDAFRVIVNGANGAIGLL